MNETTLTDRQRLTTLLRWAQPGLIFFFMALADALMAASLGLALADEAQHFQAPAYEAFSEVPPVLSLVVLLASCAFNVKAALVSLPGARRYPLRVRVAAVLGFVPWLHFFLAIPVHGAITQGVFWWSAWAMYGTPLVLKSWLWFRVTRPPTPTSVVPVPEPKPKRAGIEGLLLPVASMLILVGFFQTPGAINTETLPPLDGAPASYAPPQTFTEADGGWDLRSLLTGGAGTAIIAGIFAFLNQLRKSKSDDHQVNTEQVKFLFSAGNESVEQLSKSLTESIERNRHLQREIAELQERHNQELLALRREMADQEVEMLHLQRELKRTQMCDSCPHRPGSAPDPADPILPVSPTPPPEA